MRSRSLAVLLPMVLALGACGDDAAPAAVDDRAVASAEDPQQSSAPADVVGFSRSEDVDLAELAVESDDPDALSSLYDELADVQGWSGSFDIERTTLRFVPYPDAIEAAIANQPAVEAALSEFGPVQRTPYMVVVASFTAAPGSPLVDDLPSAADRFDDLAGCDWDGSALYEDHRWYCEAGIAESLAAEVRSAIAELAGIEPADIELVEYR